MKKFILSMSVFFGMAICANAQTVSVDDIEAVPGEKVTATLNFLAPEDKYEGVYFEMQFPATGFTTTAISGFGLPQIGDMNEGLVKITSADSKSFTEAQLQVEFTVDAAVELNEYEVTVKNIQFMNSVDKVSIDDVSFKVNVVSTHNVILDENATEAPEDAEDVNVTLKRTIKADTWSTICLPFAATDEQVKAAFGDDVELAEFTGWSSEESEEEDVANILVTFEKVDAIEANVPLLIKVSSDVESADFEGVTIEADEEPYKRIGTKKAERGTFYGTYTAGVVPEENVFLNGGKFWYSTGASKIKGFRGYFEFADVLDAYYEEAEVKVNILFNNEATGINSLTPALSEGEGAIYNLAGQRMSKAQHGINIVNGKKVIR